MNSTKQLNKILVRTNSQLESGVACLQSVYKYHGYSYPIEKLRVISGSTEAGSTFLGLSKAANLLGFQAKGCKIDYETLIKSKYPLILNIISKSKQPGYIIFFGVIERKGIENAVIGDPINGMCFLSQKQLEALWLNKICLVLSPTDDLKLFDTKINNRSVIESLQSEKKLWTATIILSILQALILTLLPLLIFDYCNAIVQDYQRNLSAAIIIITLFIISSIYLFLHKFRLQISNIYSVNMLKTLQKQYYQELIESSKSFIKSNNKTSLAAKGINNIAHYISYLTRSIRGFYHILIVAGVLIILLFKSLQIVLIVIPILILYYAWHNSKSESFQRSNITATDNIPVTISSFLSFVDGIALSKSFLSDQSLLFHSTQWAIYPYLLYLKEIWKSYTLKLYSTIFFTSIFSVVVYYIYTHTNDASDNRFVVDIFLWGIFCYSLNGTLNLKINFQLATEFLNKVSHSEPQHDGIVFNKNDFDKLTVKNLEFSIPSQNKILLNSVSFSIRKGQMINIIGENNSGKSTLCRILAKEYDFSEGSIVLNEVSIKEFSTKSWNEFLAVVPEEASIFKGSIIENIAFHDAIYSIEKVQHFLVAFEFSQYFKDLPKGFFTIVGDGGTELSLSQKHIISLARAIYHSPAIILIDNIFPSLDLHVEKFIFKILKRINLSCGIIIFSHNESIGGQWDEKVQLL